MVIEKRKFSLLIAAIIYSVLIMELSDSELYLTNIFMSVSLILGILFIYDTSLSLFSIKNIIYVMYIITGFHLRYLLILLDHNTFMKFAPRPLNSVPAYHLKTSIVLLLVTVIMIIAYRTALLKGRMRILDGLVVEYDVFKSGLVKLVYIILLVMAMGYKFLNTTIATSSAFGNLDNLFNSVIVVVQLLAYSALAYYVQNKEKKHLLIYLLYLIPILGVNIINMWKSGLLFEIIILCVALNKDSFRLKKRYIFICFFAALVAFPMISMLRDNARYDSGYEISFKSMIDYNLENNVLVSYSERLAYYDETYYCLNTSQSDINAYREEAGGIVERFFAGIIPRAIWKSKPVINSGQYVTYTLLHYPAAIYNNLTVGLISDCYISYSYLGIIIIMYLFTSLLKRLENFRIDHEGMYGIGIYLTIGRVFFTYIEGDIASKTLSLVIVLIAMFCLKNLFSMSHNHRID